MREIGDLGLYNQNAKTTPNRHYGSSYEQMGPSVCTFLMWTGAHAWQNITKKKKPTKIQPFKFQHWALHWFRARWMKSDTCIRNLGRAIPFLLHWILKRSMALLYSKNSNFLWVEELVFINGFIVHFTEFSYKVTSPIGLCAFGSLTQDPLSSFPSSPVQLSEDVFHVFCWVVLKDKRREQRNLCDLWDFLLFSWKWQNGT